MWVKYRIWCFLLARFHLAITASKPIYPLLSDGYGECGSAGLEWHGACISISI